jgi:hypothetical protein
MKKTALAVTLISGFFILLVVGVGSVEVTKANAFPSPSIAIVSPASETYENDFIWLNITILSDYGDLELEYSLDGKERTKLPVNYTGIDGEYHSAVLLAELSEGSHSVKVFAISYSSSPPYLNSETRNFNVNFDPMNPIMPIVGFTALVVIVIGIGLILSYLIKRK